MGEYILFCNPQRLELIWASPCLGFHGCRNDPSNCSPSELVGETDRPACSQQTLPKDGGSHHQGDWTCSLEGCQWNLDKCCRVSAGAGGGGPVGMERYRWTKVRSTGSGARMPGSGPPPPLTSYAILPHLFTLKKSADSKTCCREIPIEQVQAG